MEQLSSIEYSISTGIEPHNVLPEYFQATDLKVASLYDNSCSTLLHLTPCEKSASDGVKGGSETYHIRQLQQKIFTLRLIHEVEPPHVEEFSGRFAQNIKARGRESGQCSTRYYYCNFEFSISIRGSALGIPTLMGSRRSLQRTGPKTWPFRAASPQHAHRSSSTFPCDF